MTILFDVTRHFLNLGIEAIIQHSKDADESLINEGRLLLFQRGRDTSVSEEKRQILRALLTAIQEKKEADTDEESFVALETLLVNTSENLDGVWLKHNLKRSTTEVSFSALKEHFFDEMKKMTNVDLTQRERLLVDPFQVKNKVSYLVMGTEYEPLDVLLYHITMYQAEILFDEHRAIIKHSSEYLRRKINNIKIHVQQYLESADDIKPKHVELFKAKAKILKLHICLIQYEARDLYTEYQFRLWGGSMLTPYKDRLSYYMDEALASINSRWFVEAVSDELATGMGHGIV